MKNINGVIGVLLVVLIGLACSGGDDITKINTLVEEANKFLTEANKSAQQAETKGKEFDVKVDSVKSEDDLKATREMGKEMLAIYTSMQENFLKAGEKFSEAAKVPGGNAKHKEYLDLKAQEMKKRAELSSEMKAIPAALNDAESEKAYKVAAAKIVEKVKKINKEAGELSEKADKIQKENAEIIKQS